MSPRHDASALLAALVCFSACADGTGREQSGSASIGSLTTPGSAGTAGTAAESDAGETESAGPVDDSGGTKLDVGSITSGITTASDTGEICSSISAEAKQTYAPVDIVFAVDTSGSMFDEAAQVQANINNFSQQIIDSGIDAHVVMLAADPFLILPGICVPAPLGSGMCPADTKLPNYFHHAIPTPPGPIESVDGARKLIQLFPTYAPHLRPDVRKYVVIVTDDDSRNHPDSSGDAGIYDNDPDGFIADYTAVDPMMSDAMGNPTWRMSGLYAYSMCSNAAQVGLVWDEIISTTGGVSGDICNCSLGNLACAPTFQTVFDQLAEQIIDGSEPIPCQWQIPEPPVGEVLDPEYVNVEFIDVDVGMSEPIYHVDDAGACDPVIGGWYYDDNDAPKNIILCPVSCESVSAAGEGSEINLLFGCETQDIPG
ncbi:MAG: VWA domain-containing protein [Deltaproteobacteria bacterium]|nr:VWA domain-containing protein [Nannocystaceae bacterium]